MKLFLLFFVLPSLVFAAIGDLCGREARENESSVIPRLDEQQSQGFTLKQVHLFIRHGDRLPANSGPCWPNDEAVWNCDVTTGYVPNVDFPTTLFRKVFVPGKNEFAGNFYVGQLTSKGYYQHIANGQDIRTAYIEKIPLLSEKLMTSELFLRSDDEPRTMQSAQTLISGIYPNEFHKQQKNPPILDIYTRDLQIDNMEPNSNICPRLCDLWFEARQREEFQTHLKTITQPLIDEVNSRLGFRISSLSALMDCGVTHTCHSYPIPAKLDPELLGRVIDEVVFQYQYFFSYPNATENSNFGIGFLLSDLHAFLVNLTAQEKEGEEDVSPKLLVWSGHDTTLLPILLAFDVWDGHWPPYASVIGLEVYQNGTQWRIRMFYNGKELIIPGCQTPICDWSVFKHVLEALLPSSSESCTPTSRAPPPCWPV